MPNADDPTPRLTGLDLKLARIYRDLRQRDVAEALGVSHQRVGQIEQLRRPPPSITGRYLLAVERASQDRCG